MQPIALQIRRDTDARWTSTGTILRPGEQSYATDTNILKIGDGINTWTNLPPIGSSSTSPFLTENFMVAGGLGILEYSYDGLTWVTSSTNIFGHDTYAGRCNSIAWNGSTWLAVGYDFAGGISNGLIASSPDGITWTADLSGSSTIFTAGAVKTVAWNGSLWVAGGNSGINGVIATSADGKTWTAQTCPFSVSCNTVASNGNIWVAGGDTGSAVIGGNQSLAYSYDGVTWVTPPTASYEYKIQSVAWNGLIWVAVGLGSASTMFIASSSDGIIWTQRNPGSAFSAGLYSVAWNGSLWMAVGDDSSTMYAATSPNGITWTDITSNFGVTSPFIYCRSVSWNGAIWLVIGSDIPYVNSLSLTSRDTINWTPVEMGPINYFSSAAASRRLLPYIGEPSVGPTTPTLSLSYYLANNTGANTGPNAISVIGFNTPDPANSVTGGALDMNYDMSSGVLTNTSSKTISVLVSGQVTTDNTAFDLTRVQPCLYVTKNSDNIVSSSVLNFNGSAFSTIVILAPNETITIRYSQTSPYDPVLDVSGVEFLGGQFSTRITFTQMDLIQGPSSGGGADYFSGIVRSSLIPDTPSAYDLGSTGFPFHSLHVTGSTIYLGNASIKETGGTIQLVASDGSTTTGFIGPTGFQGDYTGTPIIYGVGSPDAGVGNVGDTYIQTDMAIIFSKENVITPEWAEQLNIGAIATYTPINAGIWSTAPATIQEAIDRMAAAYYTVYSDGVPALT